MPHFDQMSCKQMVKLKVMQVSLPQKRSLQIDTTQVHKHKSFYLCNLQLKHYLLLYIQLQTLCSMRPESDHGYTFQPHTTPSPTSVSSSTSYYIHSPIYRLYQGPVSVLLKHCLLLPHCRFIFSKICQNKQMELFSLQIYW